MVGCFFVPVRAIGLEPTRDLPLDPKSSASTNSATPARKARPITGTRCKSNSFYKIIKGVI